MLHFEGIAKFGVSKRINSTPAGVDQLIFGSFATFASSRCLSVLLLQYCLIYCLQTLGQ